MYCFALLSNLAFERGIFTLFLARYGIGAAQLGVLQMTLYLSTSLANVPTGLIADRFGRRASVVGGQLIIAGGILGQTAVGANFGLFVLLFAVQGTGLAFVSGAEAALLYDMVKTRGSGLSYITVRSRFNAINTTTIGIAIAIGGVIQLGSWDLVYFMSGGAMLVSAAVLACTVPEMRGSGTDHIVETGLAGPPQSLEEKEVRLREALISFGPVILTLILISSLMHATLTPYFIFSQRVLSHQGASTTAVGVVIAIGYASTGIAPLLSQRAQRRIGIKRLLPMTLLLLVLALLAVGLGNVWLTAVMFLIAVTVPEIVVVLLDNLFQDRMPSRYRATGLSVISFAETGLIAAGYLGLGGFEQKWGTGLGTVIYAAVPACALISSLSLTRVSGMSLATAEPVAQ
jgi:Major Facilitator Superfamily